MKLGTVFHPNQTVKSARTLREKGLSASKIATLLGVSDSSVLRWCIDIPSKNRYHIHAQGLQAKAKEKSTRLAKNQKMSVEKAKIFTSLLYWCEGSKYPSTNFIAFSNSDVNLIKTFITLFRTGFQPIESKFRAHLQLHTTHDKNKITSYWSKLLKIPETQFYKPTITTA